MTQLGAWMRRNSSGLVALFVFAASLTLFAWLTPRFVNTMWYPTGDEPYYLLIAHSLIHDRDIELTNNFENRDYWHYYPGELYPRHEAKTTVPGLYSKHAPGVSLLIAPAYALGAWEHHVRGEPFPLNEAGNPRYDIRDWKATVFFYNILGALLAANIYLLGYEVSRRHWVGLLLWLTLSFTNPLMSYTFLIFPALVSALMTVYAYRRIRLDGVVSPIAGNGVVRLCVVGLCLGFMPWLHARFLPLSFVLFAYLVWRQVESWWRARRAREQGSGSAPSLSAFTRLVRWLALLTPLYVGIVLLFVYFKVLYGTFMPNYADHAGMGEPEEWVVALFGSFLDQQWGLFIHAPILMLTMVGLLWMLKRGKRGEVFWLMAISVPYAIVILTYKQWWGEWCPAGRYWVSLIPLCGVPLAYVLTAPRRAGFVLLYAVLAAISWAIMAVFMYDPHLMYNHPTGSSHLLQWVAGSDLLQPLLPTYFRAEWSNVWLTVLYTELVAFIVWVGWRLLRHGPAEAPPRQ